MFVPACSLIGVNNWGMFKISVEVIDKSGAGIPKALIKTTDNQEEYTDQHGQAQLRYVSSGLHVVTVFAQGKETKQFKVSLPRDDQKQISIVLNDKVLP